MSIAELSPLGRVYCLILSWGEEKTATDPAAAKQGESITVTDLLTEANRPVDSNLLVDQSQMENDER